MKKYVLTLSILLSTTAFCWAHTPLLYVDDNYDGTISVESGFSNDQNTGGLPVLMVEDKEYSGMNESFEGKRVLFKGKFDELGCAELIKPAVPYVVIFDGGLGHIARMKGPKLDDSEREEWEAQLFSRVGELGPWVYTIRGEQ
jgi:hypothetical protein